MDTFDNCATPTSEPQAEARKLLDLFRQAASEYHPADLQWQQVRECIEAGSRATEKQFASAFALVGVGLFASKVLAYSMRTALLGNGDQVELGKCVSRIRCFRSLWVIRRELERAPAIIGNHQIPHYLQSCMEYFGIVLWDALDSFIPTRSNGANRNLYCELTRKSYGNARSGVRSLDADVRRKWHVGLTAIEKRRRRAWKLATSCMDPQTGLIREDGGIGDLKQGVAHLFNLCEQWNTYKSSPHKTITIDQIEVLGLDLLKQEAKEGVQKAVTEGLTEAMMKAMRWMTGKYKDDADRQEAERTWQETAKQHGIDISSNKPDESWAGHAAPPQPPPPAIHWSNWHYLGEFAKHVFRVDSRTMKNDIRKRNIRTENLLPEECKSNKKRQGRIAIDDLNDAEKKRLNDLETGNIKKTKAH